MVFAAILWVKLSATFVTVTSLKYAVLVSSNRMNIFVNELMQFYVNNSTGLRILTPHNMPSYTHKMAIVS